jgi:hypothetical protein
VLGTAVGWLRVGAIYRYSGEDGLCGREGAFLACSFWLVAALPLQRMGEEAAVLMADLSTRTRGQFPGSLPQGLSRPRLDHAALLLEEAEER